LGTNEGANQKHYKCRDKMKKFWGERLIWKNAIHKKNMIGLRGRGIKKTSEGN